MAVIERLRRLGGGNSVWAMAEYLWYPGLLFVSTRFFLEHLGNENYGTWMFLNAIVASSSVLNVGIGGAVIKVVSSELGAGADRRRIGAIANSALGIALLAGSVTASIMLAVVFLGWRPSAGGSSYLAWTAIAASLLIFLEHIDVAFASTLKGGEHFKETARIEMVFRSLQIVAALVVVIVWANLLCLYVTLIVVSALRTLAKRRRLTKVLGLTRVRPSTECFSLLFPYAKWGWLHGAGGFMLAVADRLLVGSLLGAEALAFYSLLLMFPQQVHSLTAAGVSVSFPRISSLLSANDVAGVRSLVRRVNLITAVSAVVISLVLIVFSDQIFWLWLGKQLPSDVMAVLMPLCAAFFILCLNVGPYYALLGMGQVRYVAILNLIAGIASIAVLVLMLQTHGLQAAALSKAVYGGILLIQFHGVSKHLRALAGARA